MSVSSYLSVLSAVRFPPAPRDRYDLSFSFSPPPSVSSSRLSPVRSYLFFSPICLSRRCATISVTEKFRANGFYPKTSGAIDNESFYKSRRYVREIIVEERAVFFKLHASAILRDKRILSDISKATARIMMRIFCELIGKKI